MDIGDRLADMDRYGVKMHVLTLTTPSVERETPEKGVKLARLANDGFSEICESHPDRFVALATLPLQDLKQPLRSLSGESRIWASREAP